MQYISGEDRNQISMLPPSIDEYVTEDNPVRVIDAFVDSLDVFGRKLGLDPFDISV